MAAPNEGSIEGRGSEELLPERGDPFKNQEDPDSGKELDEAADVLPRGLERRQEVDKASHEREETGEVKMPHPRSGPREDGGMRAVGPLLPEDLMDDSIPPPVVEPELPPPPDKDMSSLIREQRSTKGPRSGEDREIPSATEKADPKVDSLLVSELRWKRLHAKADLLRKRMSKEIDNPHLRKLLLDQINIACDQSLNTREQFEESERILNEIEGRINLQKQVQKWSASIKSWILAYELFFALIFILGLIFLPNAVKNLIPSWFPELSPSAIPDISTMINTMMWGGLGGIISALIGLWAHRALDQDIHRQWAIWFFANPFMGIVLGALIFLLLRAVLLGLFPSTSGRFQLSWILYAIAWIAGFKQNVFYDLIEHGLKLLESKRGRN